MLQLFHEFEPEDVQLAYHLEGERGLFFQIRNKLYMVIPL